MANRIFREEIKSKDKIHIMGIDEYVKLEGIEIGRKESDRRFVENLLRETEFSAERISALVGVSVEFVEEVMKSLKAE
jgi:phosphoserine phosphatase